VGVLDEEFIDIFAGAVGWGALGDRVLTVFLRVDVGWAAREQNSLTGVNEVGDGGGGREEGDFDRLAAAALNG
jgi:hypothetical protein